MEHSTRKPAAIEGSRDEMPADVSAPSHSASSRATAPELARLAAENESLRAQLALAETSATVQAMRAGAAAWDAGSLRLQMQIMRRSAFWRLTLPLRLAVDLLRGAPDAGSPGAALIRRGLITLRRRGPRAAWQDAQEYRRRRRRAVAAASATTPPAAAVAPAAPRPACEILAPHVLIVAELSVAQCAKYRVWQKQEHFQRLGVPCTVVDWHDIHECRTAAALATQAILYRVPAQPQILDLIALLESLGVPTAWEVDDLIFDEDLYRRNTNLADLDPAEQENLLEGVRLYRAALLRTGRAIASTPGLAQAMREAGVAEVAVVHNALDAETLALAEAIRATPRTARTGVLIAYGSGTRTHDADFRLVAPALARLMAARPDVRLRIVGDLTLPPSLDVLAGRIEMIGKLPYAGWMRLLAEADINLAPLEATRFNDAKSCIKLLEAAILGVPSICSPRAAFTDAMTNGQDGVLAEGDEAWFAALDLLAGDAALRARLGDAARHTALARFSPQAIAAADVAPLIIPDRRTPAPFRVLFANVFFTPRSYGGATLVVEEMASRFAASPGTHVDIVTTLAPDAGHVSLARRQQGAMGVYEMPVAVGDIVAEFDSPEAAALFGRVLDATRPHVVHLHSVQRLSASLAQACQRRGIPYVITLHDAWFLCPRQFMVRADGKYCFQTRIDIHICEACVPGAKHLRQRLALLRGAMDGAALLLSPSEAHRALFLAQGIAPNRLVVAPNGVRLPTVPLQRPQNGPLRFAYVGGYEPVKGYDVLREAAEALPRADWTLVLVDNTLNLGFSSVDTSDWRVRGKLEVVPAFGQADLDAFFAGIDVLLFPSQWKESFGLTVREALARDVWVVVTAGGGAAEAVTEGVNGTIIPLDGRPDGLRAAIEALLENPARLRGFQNPLKSAIIDHNEQAAALQRTLREVAGQSA
jgi:glycosyltransferase involved in cell wall biosynthesis